ncbi:MAG: hypothetical protein HY298_09935 [Verrucomicrobia bacterium]|nr:hypothetical protein [Verrucomicrobiota bacterium]
MFLLTSVQLLGAAPQHSKPALTLQNRYVRYELGADGRNLHFIDRATGKDYCATNPPAPFASVKKSGRLFAAASASYSGGKLAVEFGDAGVTATLKVTSKKQYFVFEVTDVRGDGVEELVFTDLPLTLKGTPNEPFAGCAVALNLQTNVRDIPGASHQLWAACYPRFGLTGARVAVIGCPPKELRRVLQEVVSAAPDLPHSPIGGPWALDSEKNRGSYLFNFGDMSEDKVDDWIKLARSLGITQIDFHGGNSFRFGDCLPNPKTYTNGWASFKAVIDKLHAAGLQAGLHTYAQFIDKRTPWVTPVPDPRLGKDATFSLAEPLTTDSTNVPVVESTKAMSAITGFAVRNSVTLQIDDELITYTGVAKEPPFAFTGCKRGANGTRVALHAQGAKVHHLKECFGLFVPDGDSTLYTEVAAKTAEAFNAGGFDMIYLDALDGSDIVGGGENAWHYQSKFTFEIWKRLKKPAMMEMSTFSHHLWFVRARMGAWDHPRRAHKKFIDTHVAANEDNRRMFLPGQLGWWSVKTWSGPQGEPTFADDIEYLMCKCLGTDTGFALMGVDPANIKKIPAYPRLATIMRQYETLRHANYFSEAVKARLRAPGDEFTLFQSAEGEWQFRRAQYDRHKVEGLDGWSNSWSITNKFVRQPLQLRIEALMSAGPYEASNNISVADFRGAKDFSDSADQTGVTHKIDSVKEPLKSGAASGRFSATNATSNRRGAWAKAGRTFDPSLKLTGHEALGVWVHGDGKGETLNLQLNSPAHLFSGIADNYIVVDFTGWRYFELIEPEAQRFTDYIWPYGDAYSIYRESIHPSAISSLNLFYNNLPPNDSVTCHLSPVRALPTIKAKWRNPSLTIGGQTIVFPVEMESGSYLELRSPADCKLYGPTGELLAEVKPQGGVPMLEAGVNRITISCDAPADMNPRAYVTAITQGEVVRGVNPANKLKSAKN